MGFYDDVMTHGGVYVARDWLWATVQENYSSARVLFHASTDFIA